MRHGRKLQVGITQTAYGAPVRHRWKIGGIAKPGETVRVPVMLMDSSTQQQQIEDARRLADEARQERIKRTENAWCNPASPFGDAKPHPARVLFELETPVSDAAGRAREARKKRLALLANAWRNPP
jgi:hypothetical protein